MRSSSDRATPLVGTHLVGDPSPKLLPSATKDSAAYLWRISVSR